MLIVKVEDASVPKAERLQNNNAFIVSALMPDFYRRNYFCLCEYKYNYKFTFTFQMTMGTLAQPLEPNFAMQIRHTHAALAVLVSV